MKKTALIFAASLTLLAGCKKDLTSLNNDPKNPSVVPSYTLFTESERLLSNTLTSSSVNLNIFRLIEQQWTETTYLNETQYQITYRKQPDNIWNAFYTGVLKNLQNAKTLMATDVKDGGTQKNEIAMADILQVYSYYYLITTFGNIPYSQALDITKPFPKYDDAKTVYYELFTRLDADIAALNTSAGSIGSADIIYGGDIGQWKKFANSIKLKMGITIADYDAATAKTEIAAAVAPANGGVFASNDDNATFNYVATPPNTNPVWVDLVQSGRHDFVGTSQFINLLNPNTATQDPRLPYYFAQNAAGTYIGASNGSGNGGIVYSQFSLPAGPLLTEGSIGSLTNPDFPGVLLDYTETAFNQAEAVQRGFITGDAAALYNSAVTSSIAYWTGSTASAAAYLALPGNTFSETGTDFSQIAKQEYLAYYNRGWDAWIATRRLKSPALTPPPNAFSAFPVRFTYPISEQNVNVVSYNQAATAIGGDLVTTKLFFEK